MQVSLISEKDRRTVLDTFENVDSPLVLMPMLEDGSVQITSFEKLDIWAKWHMVQSTGGIVEAEVLEAEWFIQLSVNTAMRGNVARKFRDHI